MVDLSLKELYERYGYLVHRRALYLLGSQDEAWDATQDVFLKAQQGLAQFEERSGILTWLTRITTYHCLNLLRARRVRRGQGVVDIQDLDREQLPAGSARGDNAERVALVRGLLELFDAETQAMAIHYYVDEMGQEEVARLTGRSVPTVRKRLRAFVDKARRLLEADPTRAVPGGPTLA